MKMVHIYSVRETWECLTSPSTICAVLVILCVQHRSTVLDFIFTAQEDGIVQTFLNLVLNLADILRGYYHISREVVRNFGQNYLFFVDDENDSGNYARYPRTERETGLSQNHDSINGPNRRGNHKRYSSLGQPPPLVIVDNASIHKNKKTVETFVDSFPTAKSSQLKVRNEMMPLPPAFSNRDDYPEGWLVYHPVLGVVSVKEAERYDEQELLTVVETEKHQQPTEAEALEHRKSPNEMVNE